MCNSDQSDFDLFADHIHAEIVIVPAMDINLFGCQYDKFVCSQLDAARAAPLYGDISFGYFPLPNCKGSALLIDEVVQSDWVVIPSGKVVQSGWDVVWSNNDKGFSTKP